MMKTIPLVTVASSLSHCATAAKARAVKNDVLARIRQVDYSLSLDVREAIHLSMLAEMGRTHRQAISL